MEEIRQCVAARAYQLYEESGRQDGNDQNNWARAESEVLRRDVEVREKGSWINVNANIPELSADDVQVHVSPYRIIVKAERSVSKAAAHLHDFHGQNKVFWIADLPVQVDPSTATASIKARRLSLMVKKREHSITSVLASHVCDSAFF